jgi:endonuclease/exonuclease/phosphatase family metal-dependent hydrolase
MSRTIHLAAWNVNHRTGRKSIPPAVLHAIATLDVDVLVLTEFVDSPQHTIFKNSLKDIGFDSVAVSLKGVRQNQVLIAARSDMADDGLLPVPGYSEAASTNWLHRRLPGLGIEVVGLRAPVYLTAADRSGYWSQVEQIARMGKDRRVIFIGDFNTDPHTDTRPCARSLQRLTAEGFGLPQPLGEWSYHSGNGQPGARVDHVMTSPALAVQEARYVYKAGRHVLAAPASGRAAGLSDHAALSVRL